MGLLLFRAWSLGDEIIEGERRKLNWVGAGTRRWRDGVKRTERKMSR